MNKRLIISIIIIFISISILIPGYFFIVDIESKIPQTIDDELKIETSTFMSRKIFTISPKKDMSQNVILYFHGGAYMAEATHKHWKFVQKLSKDTKAKIIVPDYPLTPRYTYKSVLNITDNFYSKLLKTVKTENLTIMGDSAGGGLALGLEEKLANDNNPLPKQTILISPWLDTTMSNPKIDQVQPYDKDLNKFKLYIAGIFYTRGAAENEKYFANPINGDLSKLNNLIIYTGTNDILNPDVHLLQEKASKVNVDVQIREYKEAQHIWIINYNDSLANRAYEDLLNDYKLRQ
ncbi:MAG: alpha/beta hydrolase [Clostridia bacterium]|nr:alpha/beta hydrolase [Clostridia bacterium]